jgi:Leucine-rich repeat (LRR) protein
MPVLSNLTIINNDIMNLPNLLGHHKNLKTLQVDGNPIKSLRRAIIDKGTEAILKCLREKFVQSEDEMIEEWALSR